MSDQPQEPRRKPKLETVAIHEGYESEATTGARAVPIYQTTSYRFRDAAHAASVFALKEPGFVYTRLNNPTTDVFERRVAAMEGGRGALATASGHSAEAVALLTIMGSGDELVSSSSLYGGTFNLFKITFRKLGITTHFVDVTRPDRFAAAVTARTRAIYVESIGNPRLDVPDFAALAEVAHRAGVPLVVDNTTATPALLRPIEFGADIVVESATKYMGGQGETMGGVIVDSGRFPWDNGRYPEFTEPNPGYHGLRLFEKFGPDAFIAKARLETMRDLGPAISPLNSWLLINGLETLPLRMERHSSNALAVARFLAAHEEVKWVRYPGLESDPSHANARRCLPHGCSGLVAFGIRGGLEEGRRFIDAVRLFSLVANIGDARSLVIHPASTTHEQLTSDERQAAGVTDDMIRLSVGLEHIDDILDDLDSALRAATGGRPR
jgi:O-acetylhomoserine (thiol)-lyase